MKKIKIVIRNQIYINRDQLDFDTIKALRNAFTHNNPKYFKAKALGFWVGNMSPTIVSMEFDGPFLTFPRGSIEQITEILKKYGYEIDKILDKTLVLPEQNFKLQLELYPYQREAIDKIIASGNCVFRGPCGSGKSATLIGAIAAIKQPTLIIVHTDALKKQWSEMVSKWLGFVPGSIGGKTRINIRPITIGMQQTIWRHSTQAPEWANEFGCIVFDECHRVGAATYQIAAKLFSARYRFGASADEKRKDRMEFLIYETLGPCVHEIKRIQLVQIQKLVPIEVNLVKTGFYDQEYIEAREEGFQPNHTAFINRLSLDDERNNVILKTILATLSSSASKILVLFERVESCHYFQATIKEHGYDCGIMIGGAKNKCSTDNAISRLNNGEIRVAVGTKIADEGLDIPSLTHVFVTCPIHTHPARLEQMIGRSARVYPGKTHASAVYFWDELLYPNLREVRNCSFRKEDMQMKYFNIFRKVCSKLSLWNVETNTKTKIF